MYTEMMWVRSYCRYSFVLRCDTNFC
uniref:Uncharacterized protein n=1 Tax=Arundo donax TaxID=35708 RepID=A0A0A9GBP4_ARUDO